MGNFRGEFDKWKKETGMNGPRAMDRFIMMKFMERVTAISDDFIFKGGHLLWFYIKTPRPTVDLDFATNVETDKDLVMARLSEACQSPSLGIEFKIMDDYKIVEENEKVGMAINIQWRVGEASGNKFGIDIVLGVATDIKKIQFNKQLINAASPENIIVDKFMACHSFGSGNTRAKDYDDLYRLTFHEGIINFDHLKRIAHIKGVELRLNYNWISEELTEAWERHLGKYRSADLPGSLEEVFQSINDFFESKMS